MQTHETVIRHLYESFKSKDYKGMAACYHADATFRDEAFQLKSGKEIAAMWHYLIESGKDLSIQFDNIQANETAGSAHWEAFYSFSRTGNKVHNIIEAYFLFKDGKIITHIDRFSFWRWASMALGMPGKLLGWTPFLRNSVRKTARKALDKFISKNPQYQ